MSAELGSQIGFPADPLEQVKSEAAYKRRMVLGVLESYNSNYDVLAEMVQNAVDAVEDAILLALPRPYEIHVHVDMHANRLSVRDSGVGMSREEAIRAFAPSVSFKHAETLLKKRGTKRPYRGYKGVGLTFLAYGTDDIRLHSKNVSGALIAAKMQYGHSWVAEERHDPAFVVADSEVSPLENRERGTFISVQLSPTTRPRRLNMIASEPQVWKVILQTRTAIGQIFLDDESSSHITVHLTVTDTEGKQHHFDVPPNFLLPHLVQRDPAFRFLDLPAYYARHKESANIPPESQRQDGVYLVWNTERIREELTETQRQDFGDELECYTPVLYAFLPYNAVIWRQLNEQLTGVQNRRHLDSGLLLGINRQRLADTFDMSPTRFETLSRNLFVLMHFDNAKPDQGRKTVQDDVLDLARKAADRALQYLARQRDFLKPPGDAPTAEQRQVEKNHDDWIFNVRSHAHAAPLHIPPVAYQSEPLTEQDVVGLFHQLATVGVFPGLRIFATSQNQTYDSLVNYDCATDTPGLQFKSSDSNPLGISPYILGASENFSTKYLTLEFKNNLDVLINEVETDSPKDFRHIDICVCWNQINETFKGFEIEEITTKNIDERSYPGSTHLLRKDGDAHVIQVIQLRDVVDMIRSGRIILPSAL